MNKKVLRNVGVLILGLSVLGVWGYNHYFRPDPETQAQLNEQFGEDFFTSFEDIKDGPVSQTPVNKTEAKSTEPVKEPEPGKNVSPITKPVKEQGSTSGEATPVQEESPAQTVTEADIVSKYTAQFSNLQSVALSRLDTLFTTALQEYTEKKKTGSVNRTELLQKYMQAGKTLEANVDKNFYSALNELEQELKANQLSTEVVGTYKSEYEKAKSDKRAQLLSKVLK